jgi:hypothetical protein
MKYMLGCVVSGAVLLSSSSAFALEFGTPALEHPYRSPQNFALELRFAPYLPNVDEEPGLNGTPFKNAFGDKPRLFIGLELDWQTFRIPYVGTIGPGFGVGRVSMSRPAITSSGRASGDDYGLDIYPLYAAGVFRLDSFWRGVGFPLVPYGKLGGAVGLWTASSGSDTARSSDGTRGKGASFGTMAAVGVGFPLDVLDRGASRSIDNAMGINNTYLYVEYDWLELNGLGKPGALRVGTRTWTAGLTFEF